MKNFKYLLLLIFGIVFLNSCDDDVLLLDQIKDGPNIVVFESYKGNLVGLADGTEYSKQVFVKLSGPSLDMVTSDISVTVAPASTSTAVEGDHYRIENPTITLSASNNYLGIIDIVLVTIGNAPPEEGTPEFDAYKAPILYLEMTNTSGDANVVPVGKLVTLTLNYTPFNPYAGDYDVHTIYRHPAVGTYPDNINVETDFVKTLGAITGTTVSVDWFAVWDFTSIVFKINADGSISNFSVDLVAWGNLDEDIKLGDPFDPSKVSYFDPVTRKIYLYYHYCRDSGCRVFWEVYTPQF